MICSAVRSHIPSRFPLAIFCRHVQVLSGPGPTKTQYPCLETSCTICDDCGILGVRLESTLFFRKGRSSRKRIGRTWLDVEFEIEELRVDSSRGGRSFLRSFLFYDP